MPIVVIGAGLQGSCAALELARRGWTIDLVDAADGPCERASLRNEGKIHLGFVYANDVSGVTARVMLEGALSFSPLLEEWLGPVEWTALRSRPFRYGVMRDSLVPTPELCAFYERVDAEYRASRAAGSVDYVGTRPEKLYRDPTEAGNTGPVADWIETAEVAIDLVALRTLVTGALKRDGRIRHHFGVRINCLERTPHGLAVKGVRADGTSFVARGDRVVNCAWDGRLALDAVLGIVPRRPWVHRLRYRVLVQLPSALAHLPSTTFVLGPYGDLVTWPGGAGYLSWYPTCMAGWSSDLSPPADWSSVCAGEPSPSGAAIAASTLQAFGAIIPGMADARVLSVDAGVIVAWGETDIDDPGSELHHRSEVGVCDHGDYLSVDTGKLTMAPLFARRLGDIVGSAPS